MGIHKLEASECRLVIDASHLHMKTTDDVSPLSGIASQNRALKALEFGLDIRQPRFHVVAVGDPGTGRTFSSRSMAKRVAKSRPTPDDVLLLPNPKKPSEPNVLMLPAGQGRPFVDAMEELHAALGEALRGVVEGERFKRFRTRVERRVRAEEASLEQELEGTAAELGLALERSDSEVKVALIVEDLDEEAEEQPEPTSEAMQAVTEAVERFEEQLVTLQEQADRDLRAELQRLLVESIKACFAPVRDDYGQRERIHDFLTDVETVVCREIRTLVDDVRGEEAPSLARGIVVPTLLTDHEPDSGAPVVEVPYPTLTALFGRSHLPADGTFPPEPGFAVAGALHRANGGFLLLPARALLKNGAVYEQLKACLLAGRFIVPEHDPSYFRGTVEELMLPPIPIDVKVVLIASPTLYQELHEADPEFSQLFKVQARFEHSLSISQAMVTYPEFLAGFLKSRRLPPLTADAVAELLSYGCRLIESQRKVTAQIGLIAEVATEAAYRARRQGRDIVDGELVRAALDAAQWRARYFEDEVQKLLSDGIIRIETDGERVGQVNAISVLSDGPQFFGKPCRVTAVTYPGVEGPVNIAREVEMSGPIHSKGVLILKGFLAARFAQYRPLSFGASLVFEQTYEAIDGDSASTTELYALLSSLSGMPIRQHFAVTGSVDQQGTIQPVGAINEKIESFYDVCFAKGLTGDQGVLVPTGNRDALMLRPDVVEAVAEGKFHIYAIDTVEDGIELLTGVPAGELDANGVYPETTVYGAAQARLRRFREAMSAAVR
ncbi:MAG: AAA family ATPase [Deltaproteobacteria bacterium]|jgi:predicted ATP-dependent protease|nr:AAA family ATPase [Deltaproteobacteria bacterium]MBW2530323.1 AAA family ATPase [Deltaproteobacteria bacterium]